MCRERLAQSTDIVLLAFDGKQGGPSDRRGLHAFVAPCQLAERQNGAIVNVKSGQPFTYADPCVELGPTIAYDEKAHAAAQKAVKEFFAATLLAAEKAGCTPRQRDRARHMPSRAPACGC